MRNRGNGIDRTCPKCGTVLTQRALGGLCPVCLVATSLTPRPGQAEAAAFGAGVTPARLASAARFFGEYELLEEIARGGMGLVYKARQPGLDRVVALKMILSGHFASEGDVQRFRAEARAAASLQHPNIVAVHEVGERDGQHFFTMDYVEGRDLAAVVRERPLTAEQAARCVRGIAEAIHHAHRRGILHRDLKPSNVLIDAQGQPRITDFGLAKKLEEDSSLTLSGQALGSPGYMPPEQASGRRGEAGVHSDVYSMGAVLYHLLTGRAPFWGGSVQETLAQVLNCEPVPPRALNPGVPRDLETICLKCLEKDPPRRYTTAQALADDLNHFLEGEPISARPVGPPGKAWRWARRRPALAALWAGLALSVALGFVGVSWQWRRAEQHATQAGRNAENEARERGRAEALVARLEWQRAEDALQAGDTSTALAYLAHQARSHPADAATAERLLWVLERHNFALPLVPALRHGAGINHAEFSRNGRFVVTASRDKTARVWNTRSGQAITPPLLHGDGVAVAHFSPDGSKVVTGCATIPDITTFLALEGADTSARIWDARTGELLFTLAHRGSVPAVEFSPDGRHLVTGSLDRTARVWDAATGQPVAPPLGHSGIVVVARFSPDGTRVLTAAGDTAQLWHAFNGEPAGPPLRHPPRVLEASFSPDGTRIVTSGYDQRVILWDAATGKPALAPLSHAGAAACARFSPDGRRLVSISLDQSARLWDATTGQAVGPLFEHHSWMSAAAFSPDSQCLLTVPKDNSVQLRDSVSGRSLAQPIRHARFVKAAQFSPDGQKVLTASADGTAQIWDIRPGSAAELALPHRGKVLFASFSPDADRVATASADGAARIWSAQTGAALTPPLLHNRWVSAVQFSRDGQRLLTVSAAEARVWDATTGEARLPPLKHGGRIAHGTFTPDGRWILTAGWDGRALLWDAASGQALVAPMRLPPKLRSAAFSPDGRWLGIASDSGVAQIWNAHTLEPTGEPLRHEDGVLWIEFSPDSHNVITTSWDQTARVWDAKNGRPLLAPLKHSSWVTHAAFSPDGRRIVTASRDATARLWDAATGQPLGEPLRHQGEVQFATFSPDGRRVVTASLDRTARLWDAQTGWPVCEPLAHGGDVLWAVFSADGRRLATACADRVARIWDLPGARVPSGAWLPDLAEAVAGQRLNDTGSLEPVGTDQLWKLRAQLAQTSDGDPGRWAQWFFGDRSTRPLSPLATLTAAELAERMDSRETPPGARLGERIPERDSLTSSNCIDLSAHYNAALTDDWHGRQWIGNNLATLPRGLQTLAGVPFDVRGVVQLDGLRIREYAAGYPEAVTGIEIARKVRRLHFLQATSWGLFVTNGALIGRYVVHFADGAEQTLPILNGKDTREWQVGQPPAKDLERAVVAWQGRNPMGTAVHLFKHSWENPRPEVEVESIDFVSEMTASAPFLIAITAE